MSCQLNLFSHHVRESGFRKFLVLKSRILGFGIRNSRNPESHQRLQSRIQVPLTRIWNLVTGGNPESMAWEAESKTISDSLTWGDCLVFPNFGWRLIGLFLSGDEVDAVFGFSRRLLPSNRLMGMQAKGDVPWNGVAFLRLDWLSCAYSIVLLY